MNATPTCADCAIDPLLHAEIEAALSEGCLLAKERREIVGEALVLAAVRARPRRPRLLAPLALAAAAAVVLFVAIGRRDGAPPAPGPATAERIEAERAAAEAALRRADVVEMLDRAPRDAIAVVAHGRLTLHGSFAEASREAPDAAHRFIFRVGEQGDRTLTGAPPEGPAVGRGFLRAVGGVRDLRTRTVDGRTVVPLRLGSAETMLESRDFVVSTEYPEFLVLAAGLPRFEIPGLAHFGRATYRRHHVPVGIGIDPDWKGDGGGTAYLNASWGCFEAISPAGRVREVPGFEWLTVPGGPYESGPPRRAVAREVPAFEIAKYEVTNGQWADYLREHEARLRAKRRFRASVPRHWGWDPASGAAPQPGPEMRSLPVVNITWEQAYDFCERYLGARLPTAAEWEKAARGSKDARPYPWGDEFLLGGSYVRCNSKGAHLGAPVSVFTFADRDVSPYGVVGMGGNVAEFVNATEHPEYLVPGYCGGTYQDDEYDTRVYLRPTTQDDADLRFPFVGFRPARSVE